MSILDDLGVSNIFIFGRAIYKKNTFLINLYTVLTDRQITRQI